MTGNEPLLSVESRSTARGAVLRFSGEIDMVSVDILREALMNAVTGGDDAAVVADFAEVSFCDSSGLQALDAAYALATSHGIGFKVINVQPAIRRILELVGLLDALTKPSTAIPRSDVSFDPETGTDGDSANV